MLIEANHNSEEPKEAEASSQVSHNREGNEAVDIENQASAREQ